MSTPVVTGQWAGNFDCEGPCRRKRLTANEFSKASLDKYRRGVQLPSGSVLKCKQCVDTAQAVERRNAATERQKSTAGESNIEAEKGGLQQQPQPTTRTCATCQKLLDAAEFNKNQWNKGEGKSRCRPCVETAVAEESAQVGQSRSVQIEQAKEILAAAKFKGNVREILAAESRVAALEAEMVTGLKPVRMARAGRGSRAGGARSSGRLGERMGK